jgi:hypothetical protein
MSLPEEQRALVQLLLTGDTYAGVSEVLGASPDEVRERAREALAELEREPDPELPTEALEARIRELDGGEEATSDPSAPAGPLASGRRRWGLWLAIGGALIVIAVVLVVVSSGGGGDDGGTAPTSDQEDAVPVRLSPVGGSSARGGITVIRVGDQPAVDLDIRGLTPTGANQSYVLWFVGSGGRALPVAFHPAGPDGRITGRTAIPTAATGLLPNFTTAELSLVARRQTVAAIQQAAQSGTLPERVGTVVLRGPLP